MTPKMDPKETNRALQKVKDFTPKKYKKNLKKSVPPTKMQKIQKPKNLDFSLVFTV